MKTKEIRTILDSLDAAEIQLVRLTKEYNLLTLNGHQEQIQVKVGAMERFMDVATIDTYTNYQSKLIRGREMILLGVKKTYSALILEKQAQIEGIKSKLKIILGE